MIIVVEYLRVGKSRTAEKAESQKSGVEVTPILLLLNGLTARPRPKLDTDHYIWCITFNSTIIRGSG